ncbi:hypothetical protein CG747_09555 [Streptomyces sp. CB02959]|uniref:hypothetical protein n=1 Tax=Streptomyces sp. CB02959 TaxID=2020330 RepID=UPI000C27271B|nr:hypothetical protein [Streptomyces sp. CB02959]PJN41254.1 hypothetical protein CG747_09555 [Streptomyces sp. CB02959]
MAQRTISPRLLPWTRDDGAPCYLITDDPDSRMSLLADDVEEEMLAAAGALLAATDPPPGPEAGRRELRGLVAGLRAALRDVRRIAVSRGERLPEPCDPDEAR